jgi:hypothetical protein
MFSVHIMVKLGDDRLVSFRIASRLKTERAAQKVIDDFDHNGMIEFYDQNLDCQACGMVAQVFCNNILIRNQGLR